MINKILKHWKVLGFVAIYLVLLVLRLYRLSFHDFWYDEIGTIGYAQYPWGNWNAPLYWIVLHYWIKIFGISEFTLRLPSAIFSFLSVILVYYFGKSAFNKKIGILASILMGLSPFHLWYAQEARDYSMILFLGLLSSLLLYRALKEGRYRLWAYFSLVSIAAFYTNYFYILLFFAQCLCFISYKRLKFNFKEVIFFLIIIFSFVFYLARFLSKFYYVWNGFWILRPNLDSIIITFENFILGYNGFSILYLISNVLCVLLFVFSLKNINKSELRRPLIFCAILLFFPILCAYFFSTVLFSVYLDRGLIIFSPYYYLILSIGIISLHRKVRRVLFAILMLTFLIADYRFFNDQMFASLKHHTGAYIKKPIRPIVEFIENNLQNQDVIAFTNESLSPSLSFYLQKRQQPFYYFFDPSFPDGTWQRPIAESKFTVPLHKIAQLSAKRIWVISCDWARSGVLDENSQSVKNWCDSNLRLEFAREFDGAWVLRYVK